MAVISGVLDDAVGAARGVVRTVTGAASDAADVLGVDVVTGPIVDVWEGPLRDWAHTDVGKTMLRAMGSAGYFALVPALGPQLAAVSFAWPGLVRGEPIDVAWLTEFSWRVEKTAEILGAEIKVKLGDELARVLGQLHFELDHGNREILSWSAERVADYLSVPRVDVVAAALSLIKRSLDDLKGEWDPATGARRSSMASRIEALGVQGQAAPLFVRSAVRAPGVASHTMTLPAAAGAGSSATVEGAGASSPSKVRGDVMLGVVVAAAIGALVWWRSSLDR